MERNRGAKHQAAKFRRRAVVDWLLTKIVGVALVAACVISFVSTQVTLMEKRQEAAELEQAIEQAKEEQSKLQKFADAENIEEYLEKAAIEDHNYAYPNERRFFDTSRN